MRTGKSLLVKTPSGILPILYVVAFSILMFVSLLGTTAWGYSIVPFSAVDYFMKAARYFTYVLCIVKILLSTYRKKKQFLLSIGMVAISILVMLFSEDREIVIFTIFLIAAYEIDDELIVQTSVFFQSLILFIATASVVFGVVENYYRLVGRDRPRYFMGFGWTTTAPVLLFFIVLEYLFLKKGIIHWKMGLLFLGISSYYFYMTGTRMAFLMTVVVILFFLIYTRFNFIYKKPPRWIRYLLIATPFLLAALSFFAVYLYDKGYGFAVAFDKFFSNRLQLSSAGLKEFGISIFGQSIHWVGFSLKQNSVEDYNYVDSSYVQIAINYGVLFLVMILSISTFMVYRAIKTERYYLAYLLFFIFVLSLTEPRLINLIYNPFYLTLLAQNNYVPVRSPRNVIRTGPAISDNFEWNF